MSEKPNPLRHFEHGEIEKREDGFPQDQLRDFIVDIELADDDANLWERMGEHGNADFEALHSVNKKLEALAEKYADFLKNTGMVLDLRESTFLPLPEEGREKSTSKHIIINIVDKEKFISLLEGFDNLELDKNRIAGLSDLAFKIQLQIQRFYKVHESDDDFLGVIPVIKVMAEKLEKFSQTTGERSLRENAEAFMGYSQALSGKYLREFLLLENLEYDWEYHVTDEYYGRTPSPETHSVKGYEEILDRFLENMKKCAENKNARELVRQKIDWFKKCLDDAEKVLLKKTEKKKRGYIVVNQKLSAKLEELEEKIK